MKQWFPPLAVWLLFPITGIALWYAFGKPPPDFRSVPPENSVSADTKIISHGEDIALSSALSYEAVLREVEERPLFSETRRVPSAVVETPPPATSEEVVVVDTKYATVAAPEPPKATYQGYMLTDGSAKALIVLHDAQKETWLSVGDMLRKWSILKIDQSAVHLELQGFQHVLKISR